MELDCIENKIENEINENENENKNELDGAVDEMTSREICYNTKVSLVEQEFEIKRNLLVNDLKMSVDDGNRLKESNKQLCFDMMILKMELSALNVKYDNATRENKWLRQKNARQK